MPAGYYRSAGFELSPIVTRDYLPSPIKRLVFKITCFLSRSSPIREMKCWSESTIRGLLASNVEFIYRSVGHESKCWSESTTAVCWRRMWTYLSQGRARNEMLIRFNNGGLLASNVEFIYRRGTKVNADPMQQRRFVGRMWTYLS